MYSEKKGGRREKKRASLSEVVSSLVSVCKAAWLWRGGFNFLLQFRRRLKKSSFEEQKETCMTTSHSWGK